MAKKTSKADADVRTAEEPELAETNSTATVPAYLDKLGTQPRDSYMAKLTGVDAGVGADLGLVDRMGARGLDADLQDSIDAARGIEAIEGLGRLGPDGGRGVVEEGGSGSWAVIEDRGTGDTWYAVGNAPVVRGGDDAGMAILTDRRDGDELRSDGRSGFMVVHPDDPNDAGEAGTPEADHTAADTAPGEPAGQPEPVLDEWGKPVVDEWGKPIVEEADELGSEFGEGSGSFGTAGSAPGSQLIGALTDHDTMNDDAFRFEGPSRAVNPTISQPTDPESDGGQPTEVAVPDGPGVVDPTGNWAEGDTLVPGVDTISQPGLHETDFGEGVTIDPETYTDPAEGLDEAIDA